MKAFLFAAVAALAVSSPAFAQDVSIEVQGGYDAQTASGAGGSIKGASYGATLAFELPVDETIFVGAEVSLDNSTTDECAGARTALEPEVCVAYGRDFTVGLRGGVDLGKSSSIYATVGYTNLRASVATDDGTTADKLSGNVEGVKLGVGYRQWFGKRAYGKLEYRYSNLEAGLERHQGLVGVGYQF
jgi:outer membrane immunogenic protein